MSLNFIVARANNCCYTDSKHVRRSLDGQVADSPTPTSRLQRLLRPPADDGLAGRNKCPYGSTQAALQWTCPSPFTVLIICEYSRIFRILSDIHANRCWLPRIAAIRSRKRASLQPEIPSIGEASLS